jgi:hypothetical protein
MSSRGEPKSSYVGTGDATIVQIAMNIPRMS